MDRTIQAFYNAAVEDEWLAFREHALQILCEWLGAQGGVWHTRSGSALPGEFTEFPAGGGLTREDLRKLPFTSGVRELELNPLPAALVPANSPAPQRGYAVHYAHRGGGDLSSTVLVRLPPRGSARKADDIRRVIGHMVEAGTLALRNFIQRDEWLHTLGRSNRGCAALIDSHGAIYVASQRFRDLVAGEFGTAGFSVLPCPVPAEAVATDGSFTHGALHFRLSRQGPLHVLYVRRRVALDGLSPREQEIARALSSGMTFKTVARQYGIAISTVANHASRIYKKLGVYRREDLVNLVRDPGKSHPLPVEAGKFS
ncbi:MAG: helix-turn-helix transcriptional regulator [Stenotrophobium sp.]